MGGIVAAAVFMLAGCQALGPDPAGPSLSLDCAELDASGGAPVEASLTVPVGSQFEIILCSNPSTGFTWETPAATERKGAR